MQDKKKKPNLKQSSQPDCKNTKFQVTSTDRNFSKYQFHILLQVLKVYDVGIIFLLQKFQFTFQEVLFFFFSELWLSAVEKQQYSSGMQKSKYKCILPGGGR